MKCSHCQSEMKRGKVPLLIADRPGNKIDAWVCERCGNHYLDEDDTIAAQERILAVERKPPNDGVLFI